MGIGRKTILALLAIAATIGSLWLTKGAMAPKKATWDDVKLEASKGGYRLISTDDLWKIYDQNRDVMLIVDTRQPWEYRSGHIQGAVNFPMESTWLARWRKKGALGRLLGEDKGRALVFY